jgi:hypothetical protein
VISVLDRAVRINFATRIFRNRREYQPRVLPSAQVRGQVRVGVDRGRPEYARLFRRVAVSSPITSAFMSDQYRPRSTLTSRTYSCMPKHSSRKSPHKRDEMRRGGVAVKEFCVGKNPTALSRAPDARVLLPPFDGPPPSVSLDSSSPHLRVHNRGRDASWTGWAAWSTPEKHESCSAHQDLAWTCEVKVDVDRTAPPYFAADAAAEARALQVPARLSHESWNTGRGFCQ